MTSTSPKKSSSNIYAQSSKSLQVRLESQERRLLLPPLQGEGNVPDILSFFGYHPLGFRYDVKNVAMGTYRHSISHKTVARMLTNGHLDSEIYMFINPKTAEKRKTLYGFRSEWITEYGYSNFVLDFDNCPHANSPEEMAAWLRKVGFVMPGFIVQTSPNSFHVAYLCRGELSKEDVWKYAMLAVGAESPTREAEDAFEARYGLDLNYLRQNHKEHKVRVPGSINTNHLDSDGKPFVCKAWYNDDVQYVEPGVKPRLEYAAILDTAKEKKTLNRKALAKYKEFLAGKLSKKMANKVALYMAYNSGFLASGNCAISQTAMAVELKMLQPSVSRLLKKLIRVGFLRLTNGNFNYRPGGGKVVCREYGLGEEMAKIIGSGVAEAKVHAAAAVEKLAEEYVPGERNAMAMEDVRNLRYLGISMRQQIEFLMKKNDNYSRANRKAQAAIRDIQYMIENFETKARDLATLRKSIDLPHSIDVALKNLNLIRRETDDKV